MMRSIHCLKCAGKKNGLFFQLIVCLIISILVGMLLLVCVNFLPQERIKNHVRDGATVILQEHAEYQYAEGYVESIYCKIPTGWPPRPGRKKPLVVPEEKTIASGFRFYVAAISAL